METMFKAATASHKEGKVAKTIEEQTAKLPSDLFLWTGLGAIGVGFIMQLFGARHSGIMVSQLGSPLLIMGLYNKVVKVEGHDKYSK
jgi:hypothetical protein